MQLIYCEIVGYKRTIRKYLLEDLANGTHLHAGDKEIPIIQHFQLSDVADGSHDHSADSGLDLVQSHRLVVADASHSHTATTPELVQNQQLTVSNSVHPHTGSTVSLVQGLILSVDNGMHDQSADGNVDLIQAHVLSPIDASHPHIADTLTLSQSVILDVASGQHSHISISAGVLTQHHLLSVAGAVHEHTAQVVFLVPMLQVHNTVHAHRAESSIVLFSGGSENVIQIKDTSIFYICTLTGDADGLEDVELPISSLRATRRSGSLSYLYVVVPSFKFLSAINARPHGDIKIDIGYMVNGEMLRELFMAVNFNNPPRLDRGPKSQSITLSGSKTTTYASKSAVLSGATYYSQSSGRNRLRIAATYTGLNPGDVVTASGYTFPADIITYMITPKRQYIEIAEI